VFVVSVIVYSVVSDSFTSNV